MTLIYDFQYCGRAPPTVDLAYFFLAYFFCFVVGDTDDKYLEFYHKQLSTLLDASCNWLILLTQNHLMTSQGGTLSARGAKMKTNSSNKQPAKRTYAKKVTPAVAGCVEAASAHLSKVSHFEVTKIDGTTVRVKPEYH